MGIVVLGSGGHARVLLDLLNLSKLEPVAALIDENPARWEITVNGHKVLGGLEQLPEIIASHQIKQAVIAVGDPAVRRRWAHRARSLGLDLPVLVHPAAIVSPTAELAEGTVVLAGAVVGVNVAIGALAIINTKASVDHECRIGDYSHIAPGATLAGNVTVEDGVLVGAGATIIPGIKIGSNSIVGAGATVIHDVPPNVTVVGCPAKQLRRSL